MLCVCLCLFGWRLSSVTTTGRDLHWITAEAGLFWPRSQGLPREGVEATGLGHCDREGGTRHGDHPAEWDPVRLPLVSAAGGPKIGSIKSCGRAGVCPTYPTYLGTATLTLNPAPAQRAAGDLQLLPQWQVCLGSQRPRIRLEP